MNNVFRKVYMWMFVGLLVTFLTGYFVSTNEMIVYKIYNSYLYWVFSIIELVLVVFISFITETNTVNVTASKILFILYSFVTGLTFSAIFIAIEMSSIMIIFLITALLFLVFSVLGYVTELDLTQMGTFMLVGAIGVFICSIVNFFLGNGVFEIVICSIGILIFLGFTAYDVNKIKYLQDFYRSEDALAIAGALKLYLDFINNFILLLSLFGNDRDKKE